MVPKLVAVLLGLAVPLSAAVAWGQAPLPPPTTAQPPDRPPALRRLTGDDARRADQLNEQINNAIKERHWAEAIASAEKLTALRVKIQGAAHFEAVAAGWTLKTLLRVEALSREDQAAYLSAFSMSRHAVSLAREGKPAEALAHLEEALAIRRRLLTDDHPYTAISYENLGSFLSIQGKHAEAQPHFEKALAIRCRVWTDDGPETALGYDNLAVNLGKQKKYAQAQAFFEKALAIRRKVSADDQSGIIASLNNLAYDLDLQGKHAAAQPLLEELLAIRCRVFTRDHADKAYSYQCLAVNLDAQRKYAAAQPLFETALEMYRHLRGDNHLDTVRCYDNLATNLGHQAKHAEAQHLFERSLEIRQRLLSDNHPDTARGYDALAVNLLDQGRFAAAQPLLERSLEIRRRLLTDNHPDTAGSYSNLGAALLDQGKEAEAQPFLEKALAICRRLPNDNRLLIANFSNNLALALEAQGKSAEARKLLEEAFAIQRQLLPDDHPDAARSVTNLAIGLYAKRKYAEVEPLFEKLLAIRRQSLHDDHPATAGSYVNLANSLSGLGKHSEAQPLYEKALDIDRRLLGDDHPDTAKCSMHLAQNLWVQGKYAEARGQWTLAAHSFESARLSRAFTGLDRVNRAARDNPWVPLASVLARLNLPGQAWQRFEEGLGRGLLDELAARRDERLTPQERTETQQRVAELERLDRLFEASTEKPGQADQQKRLEQLRAERDRAKIRLGELQSRLARKYEPIAGQVAGLSEIQLSLPIDAALVSWVDRHPEVHERVDHTGERWGVVVRARGTPTWIPLPGTAEKKRWSVEDEKLAGMARDAFRQGPRPAGADPGPLIKRLRAQRLLPLTAALRTTADGLPAVRRLIVLPSEAMTAVPLETLLQLGDPWTVSYAPSGTVLTHLRKRPKPDSGKGLLAVGDPIFASPDPRPLPADVTANDQRRLGQMLAMIRSGSESFESLPGTRHEVEALAQLFKTGRSGARVLTDSEASEPTLDHLAASGELGGYAFIHLATHGVIDETNPRRTAVILTQTGLPDPLEQVLNHKPVFDGRLSVPEIQSAWNLKAELVTISACETARGYYADGEGFVGFTQALLVSGARSVCLSLWKVDDTATALLMERFYANFLGVRPGLAQKMPKAEALAEAKAWLRGLHRDEATRLATNLSVGDTRGKDALRRKQASPAVTSPAFSTDDLPYAHPYFWAAFVLVGDPD